MSMRGGFLLGAAVGAAVTTYLLSRRNNQISMARMGKMVTDAIGDGFKLMTTTSQASDKASSTQKTNNKSTSTNQKQDTKQIEQLIAQDANVQKEVNKILSQSH